MLCPLGILLALVYQQSPTSLIGEPPRPARVGAVPRGSRYAQLGPQGLGPREAAARLGESSRRAYRIVCLRRSVSTCIQNCLSTWEPFWDPDVSGPDPNSLYYLSAPFSAIQRLESKGESETLFRRCP